MDTRLQVSRHYMNCFLSHLRHQIVGLRGELEDSVDWETGVTHTHTPEEAGQVEEESLCCEHNGRPLVVDKMAGATVGHQG